MFRITVAATVRDILTLVGIDNQNLFQEMDTSLRRYLMRTRNFFPRNAAAAAYKNLFPVFLTFKQNMLFQKLRASRVGQQLSSDCENSCGALASFFNWKGR